MSWYFQSTDRYAQRIAYKAGTDLEEYIGETHPKNQHKIASAVWRITKITYDGSNRIISILWADRSEEFAFIWNQHATYNYT